MFIYLGSRYANNYNVRVSRAKGPANYSIVFDEGVHESCGNNHNTQFPGCLGKQFKASLLAMCAFA